MNVSTSYGRERMAHPGPFSSTVGQQFHTTFPSANSRPERPDGRSFEFPDGMLQQDQIVLEPSSGKILAPLSRNDQEHDPITRFYNNETPWNPQGIENVNPWPPTFITNSKQSVVRPHAPYPGYRDHPRSNPDSHVTGRQQPDSGYVTNGGAAKSIISGGEVMDAGDDTQSFINGIEGMQLQPNNTPNNSFYSGSTQAAPPVHPSFNHQLYEQEHEPSTPLTCSHPDCKEETQFKNASELKKHQQRHEKPHKCTVSGCTRKDGFTTKNDLDRHKKSLHGISLPNDRSFKCAGAQCNKRGKIWPRLDNFKSHCQRMHSKEDLDELLKKSEIDPENLNAFQSLPNRNLPESARPYVSNESGCIQDATLLLDLSHRAHHSNNSYPSAGRNPGVNQIVSPLPVPLPSQRLQDPSARVQLNRVDSTVSHRSENAPGSTPQIGSLHPPVPSSQLNPPAVGRSDLLRSSASNERLVERPQLEYAKQNVVNQNLLVTTKEIEDCSAQLVTDLVEEFGLEPHSRERVFKSIDRRMKHFTSTLQLAKTSRDNDAALEEPSPRPKRVRCRICSKTMDRPCDLKKHEKRHSRPWGCTNAICNKTFGSKNDWKRHENSQHYQLETWRCHEALATSKIGTCAKIFFRRDPFQAHLRRDHGIPDEEYIREQLRKRRIGRNWQNGFWCGFCKDIVKLSTRGLEAWDERFNHIDDMHFKQGQRIDDWYPMDKDLPKGKLKGMHLHHRRRRHHGGSMDDVGADGDDLRESVDPDRDGDEESEPDLERSDDSEQEDYPPERTKRRRSGSDDGRDAEHNTVANADAAGREATPRVAAAAAPRWYCDNCGHGPMQTGIDFNCVECNRRKQS